VAVDSLPAKRGNVSGGALDGGVISGGAGGGIFLIAKMSQNLVYDVLVLNTRNVFDRSAAATADLYVNIENAFQALGPVHRGVALGG